jgi:hypothetical protein
MNSFGLGKTKKPKAEMTTYTGSQTLSFGSVRIFVM